VDFRRSCPAVGQAAERSAVPARIMMRSPSSATSAVSSEDSPEATIFAISLTLQQIAHLR
jgi:hypothetical protein